MKKNIYALAASLVYFLAFLPVQAIAEQTPDENVQQQVTGENVPQLSAEERKWFEKFQEGTFYAQGWKKITANILQKTPQELRQQQRLALESLGNKIGCEWSKGNEIRKIDTDMLRQWGKMLKKTAGQEPQQLPRVIAELDHQVAMLLE